MTKPKGTALQQWSLGWAAAETEKGQSSTVALLHFKNKAHQFPEEWWRRFFSGFRIRPGVSQHNPPKDTRGRKGNAQTSIQGEHCRASLTFVPPLPAKGGTRTEKPLRLCREQGTGLAFPLQRICYSFPISLSCPCAPRGTTPFAIIWFSSFTRGLFLRSSVPGWSCSATFSKIFSGIQATWFGDLQLLHFMS